MARAIGCWFVVVALGACGDDLPAASDAAVADAAAADAAVDDNDGSSALLANAARSPMGTLPFATMPPPPPAVDDFTLHADTAVAAHDRDGLERLERGAEAFSPHDAQDQGPALTVQGEIGEGAVLS